MIVAEFFENGGEIKGFKINGHAGYDDYGKDIACASVSSAVQMTVNAITDVFGFEADVSAQNNTVFFKTASGDIVLQKLYKAFIMRLELLSQEFNETIKIKFTEV